METKKSFKSGNKKKFQKWKQKKVSKVETNIDRKLNCNLGHPSETAKDVEFTIRAGDFDLNNATDDAAVQVMVNPLVTARVRKVKIRQTVSSTGFYWAQYVKERVDFDTH